MNTLFSQIAGLTGPLAESADGRLGILMSALAGIAAALAVALAMTVYFRLSYRTWRDVVRHGLAVLAATALFAFAAYDMRHAALAFLVPGSLDQLTGGYLFARRVVEGLRALGRAVTGSSANSGGRVPSSMSASPSRPVENAARSFRSWEPGPDRSTPDR